MSVLDPDYTPLKRIEEQEAREGDWYLLWPGFYGPFTACWVDGRWFFAAAGDLSHATVGRRINAPGQDLGRNGRTKGDFKVPFPPPLCPACGYDHQFERR